MVKRKGKDLFKSCTSPGFLLAFVILIISYFFSDPMQQYIQVFFFFFISWACFKNFKQCGRIHCKYTGPGFLIVAIISLLVVLNVINLPWNWVWWIFIAVAVIGYGIEFSQKGKSGTCYEK